MSSLNKDQLLKQLCVCLPVRFGSTRLPGKPLLQLGGMTVIEQTLSRVCESKYLLKDQIWLFTDDQRIAQVVKDNPKLSGIGTIMATDECPNALYRLSRYANQLPDRFKTIINLHGDEPLLDVRNLDFLIEQYLKFQQPVALIRKLHPSEATRLSEVKVVFDIDHQLIYCSRAWIPHTKSGQIKDQTYWGMMGVHLLDRETLFKYTDNSEQRDWLYQQEDIEELKLVELGIKVKCVEAPFEARRSLNTAEDYRYLLEMV